MKRLTTNCPDNNLDAALNLFYIKDFETWVRGGGDGPDYPDIRLYDFIRKAAKILLPDLDFPVDDDGVDYAMGELLLDGPDEPTGLLALLYTAAWSYAELRGRLMQYEDTGLTPEEVSTLVKDWSDLRTIIGECGGLDRVRELAEADRDGRLVVLPCNKALTNADRMMNDLKPCPFCGGKVSLVLCDDEGNLHDEAYREHPYSGLGFMLHHAHEENPECPIASYECDGGILGGVHIYDTEEQAAEAWNRRADNDTN